MTIRADLGVLLIAIITYADGLAFSSAPTEATSLINLRGIKGYVFFRTLNETSTLIRTNFTGLGTTPLNWHVHRFPVDLTLNPNIRCLSSNVGGHYDPLMAGRNPNYSTDCSPTNQTSCEIGDLTGKFGRLQNGVFEYIDNTGLLDLGGLRGIVGRSIVIHATTGENFVCGTIRSSADRRYTAVTLSATFIAPLAGVIYMRQVADEHAVIFGKLFWVDGREATRNHNWHIHVFSPSDNYRTGNCSGVGGHFDPFLRRANLSEPYYCSPEPSNITNCEVGDLTGKHDTVNVAANPLPYQREAFFYTDIFLNLTGVRSVVGRSIAIHAANRGGRIIACAPLVETEERFAIQFPNQSFVASQKSPYELTRIATTNLPSPNVSILSEVFTTYNLCPANRPTYDPFPSNEMYAINTLDTYPVGALYQKHQMDLASGLSTTELPVHGVNTITSRSLRVIAGNRRICSSILANYSSNTTVVGIASFNGTIEGNIIFIQERLSNNSLGITNIIVDIYYTNESQTPTLGHNWHIHTRPPAPNEPCQGNIGPHFNPFNVSLNSSNFVSNYSQDCSPRSPLRCESGDMSGKHGRLRIDPPGPNMSTYSYLDPSLYLFGPTEHTIIGRSVGIHQNIPMGPLLYCAEVQIAYFTTVVLTITELSNYNRVEFVRGIATAAGLPTQSILVQNVDVGIRSTSEANCVQMTLSTFGNTIQTSNRTASILQESLCDMYRDDICMRSQPDFNMTCGASVLSSFAVLMFLSLVVAMLFY